MREGVGEGEGKRKSGREAGGGSEGEREEKEGREENPEARSAGNREEREERSKQGRGRKLSLGSEMPTDPVSASRSRGISRGARPGKHGQADTSEHRQSREGERERREAEESEPVHGYHPYLPWGPGPTVGRVIASKGAHTRARGGRAERVRKGKRAREEQKKEQRGGE